MEVPTSASASNWLLQRGYMVVLPLRRGYGQTGGPWLESYGACSNPDYYRAGLTSAADIEAAIGFFRKRSEVRARSYSPDRMVGGRVGIDRDRKSKIRPACSR